MTNTPDDFRERFGRMAPEAIVNAEEVAQLLATTKGALRQMIHRRELPPTAFPEKRRTCWLVSDIRQWLQRKGGGQRTVDLSPKSSQAKSKVGRPRMPHNLHSPAQ
ncbi:helix-turn-helix transcriptional regulator [Achromobacter piechaudii]|uniref:helix-turn-helix transcriptional regulator n=1 Tax=Achromobacter piechaudii TaxID=72556 RepID=UPI0012F493B0|nr:helix-turn-helix domain-containing protein [Achromobacter piechaudii]